MGKICKIYGKYIGNMGKYGKTMGNTSENWENMPNMYGKGQEYMGKHMGKLWKLYENCGKCTKAHEKLEKLQANIIWRNVRNIIGNIWSVTYKEYIAGKH